jgi:hypothetical protein
MIFLNFYYFEENKRKIDSSGFDHLEIVVSRMVTDDLSDESDYHSPEDGLYRESKEWMNF